MIELIESLYAHMGWADDRVLEALERAGPEQRARASEIYAHILGAEHVWLRRMQNHSPEHAVWPKLDAAECRALARQNMKEYGDFISSLAADGFDKNVSYVNSAGTLFNSTIVEILTHVAMHGSYHRGQVALLLRAAGAEPAATDYIAYTRGSPAATRRTAIDEGLTS
jgi:uncharacterized damage-inducible protein DinB